MQGPIDYTIQRPDIAGQIKSTLKAFSDRQKQNQFREDLAATLKSPTQAAFTDLLIKHPGQAKAISALSTQYGEARLKSEFAEGMGVSSALEAGNTTLALDRIESMITARKDLPEHAGTLRILNDAKGAIESGNATGAQAAVNIALSLTDPEGFKQYSETRAKTKETRRKEALHESALLKSEAEAKSAQIGVGKARSEATKAATEARYAHFDAVKKGLEIGVDMAHLLDTPEFQRQYTESRVRASEIARLEQEGKRVDAEKKRLELRKLDAEMQEAANEKLVAAQSALTGADAALDAVDEIIAMGDVKLLAYDSSVLEASTGSVEGVLPVLLTSQEVADFKIQFENAKAKAFEQAVEKLRGLGPMTEMEAKAATAAIAQLDLQQSPAMVKKNLGILRKAIESARDKVLAKEAGTRRAYGIPQRDTTRTPEETKRKANDILSRGK
jgi:hypothetical protein